MPKATIEQITEPNWRLDLNSLCTDDEDCTYPFYKDAKQSTRGSFFTQWASEGLCDLDDTTNELPQRATSSEREGRGRLAIIVITVFLKL